MSIGSPRRGGDAGKPAVSMGQLGMIVLLVSISVLFVAASVAVIITRTQVTVWRGPESSGLPWGLVASTALILVVSWLLQAALGAVRANRFTLCLTRLRWGIGAAVIFLAVQALNARHLVNAEGSLAARGLYVFSYGLLVGLHGLHVVGGFVPLAIVHGKVTRRDYSSSRHAGFAFCVQYWHYLAVIWLLLLATLAGIN